MIIEVVLVGDMTTEEAIPTFQTILNTMDAVRDVIGAFPSPRAIWTRAWTAEENRHDNLLNKYLYLSGRVDMQRIEKTNSLADCLRNEFEHSLYNRFIYTSFQERATFTSHGNKARLAEKYGDVKLAQICGIIVANEKRHEATYVKVVEKLFEIDLENTMLALEQMMRGKIVMLAHLLYNGKEEGLFDHYLAVAQRIEVYMTEDYADIMDVLVARWKLGDLSHGLSVEGRRARDFACGLSSRILMLAERAESRAQKLKSPPMMRPFSWVFDRQVQI